MTLLIRYLKDSSDYEGYQTIKIDRYNNVLSFNIDISEDRKYTNINILYNNDFKYRGQDFNIQYNKIVDIQLIPEIKIKG